MTSYIFDSILSKATSRGLVPAKEQAARDWFRRTAAKTTVTSKSLLTRNVEKLVSTPIVGQMYAFAYDPKHKKTLPYYDRFPVIFPFDHADGGFYGLNMHYLPPVLRANLMDALYSVVSNKKFDRTTHLRINYDILKSAGKFKWYKPCVKRYLNAHVRTRFLKINADEWDIALMLPVARFQKATQDKVWRESRKMIA